MRAMVIDQLGDAGEIHEAELPKPEPTGYDLLVEVHASAMNPVDFKVRQTGLGMERQFPLVLGYDVCGKVVGLGDKCERFREGELVYACPSLARQGANAEYVLIDERTAAVKPETLSDEEAAALPLVALTAFESLHKRAGIHHEEAVLITAGGGGVGHVAVQLAKANGNRVLTSASREESIRLCHDLGADVVINYREEDWAERVMQETGGKGCEVVLDCVGGETFVNALDCVTVNGRLVSIVHTKTDQIAPKLFKKNATLHLEFMGVPPIYGINLESHGEILRTVAELVDAGKLKPHVSKVYDLKDLADVHREQETGHVTGKLVVKVKS